MTKKGVVAILAGGLIGGTIDITQALILFGSRVPMGISAALLGKTAERAGPFALVYGLGLLLHYSIATTWTAAYYLASRKLTFMTEHWIVCGLLYGMVIELCMSYIVLPLSALHATGPYELKDVLLGVGVHMFSIGLPIAFSVRRFG
jgi:hypothetical protein